MATKRPSQFGIKWNPTLPRSAIEWLLNRVHVGTSDEAVSEMIRERCELSNIPTRMIPQCVRFALLVHERNQRDFMWVMGGH